MTMKNPITIDGNEAAATVAYKTNEVIAIYPITPSSTMAELADQWSAAGKPNLFGVVPLVQEMQSEGGAAGAVHGSLQAGSLTTTFTASQGLLLMIPNMFKIAGELTSTVFHVSARAIAAQGLSIFGDHSDIMAARSTGFAILLSNSVQEAHDFALIAQAATLRARVPFIHAFDGFRTSHEVQKIEMLTDEEIRAMIPEDLVRAHRDRALNPERPVIRGTAQNPDVYFQGRETVNPFYAAAPGIVQQTMDRFAEVTGRRYSLFEYFGDPEAERVLVMMGSGAETAEEAIEALNAQGERVGVIKVRLFRPFSGRDLIAAMPPTVKRVAVLDRTKEPGANGEPLYQDVAAAVLEAVVDGTAPFQGLPRVVGGRYGLGSKEFTPAMVKGVFDELAKPQPKNHFTVGIVDDVANTSIDYDSSWVTEPDDVVKAVFWGLGSDGTVGANKNSIKIIGEETDNFAQGYFVYDSKKSGSVTVSHLRFGPRKIKSTYLLQKADFVAVHQFGLVERYPVLDIARVGATFLLNSPIPADRVWDELPEDVQRQILEKRLRFFTVDAYEVARKTNMGSRINTIMQVAFFALSGVLPRDEAIQKIREAIQKTYGRRGEAVVRQNFAAVDMALDHIHEVRVPQSVTGKPRKALAVSEDAPEFVRTVTTELIAGRGDALPVSKMPVDGTFPTGTAKWEKRNIALEAPVWDENLCIQCGKCSLVCPHSVIRTKIYPEAELAGAPEGFRSAPAKWREYSDRRFTLQLSVEDCTGCGLCVEVCPAKDKANVSRKALQMEPIREIHDREVAFWNFFDRLTEYPKNGSSPKFNTIKNVQLLTPLFEFSGACAGCGETPYVKLVSQLFGDRALIANATGCSSIYGGNLPTTPWTTNKDGRGPAWSNSLFEDNAEFGYGMRLALDHQNAYAKALVAKLRDRIRHDLAERLLADRPAVEEARENVAKLKEILANAVTPEEKDLLQVADALIPRSVWIIGGDGWAYDIGYGGLDHVLASGRNVNVLVLDTEVYSNTGGQASKSTSRGAVAKFAAGGKPAAKKDLGRMAMQYGNVYVAQVAMGASDAQTLRAFLEAEAYDGPSLIIAYAHCIAHGIDMRKGLDQQRLAVECGHWPLYRYNPALAAEGKNPLQIDSKPPSIPYKDYAYNETRYRMLAQSNPDVAAVLLAQAETDARSRYAALQKMAETKESSQ
ncbi:MAG: pyruvate:ferredoxin (flavodoxin) oxidoreductase [Fimbriimonadales bacterium]|nr:pyruvate:ferredoxin (flavodoxin) oxidoreductase [Fimbriimonadales bacterium]